MFLYDTFPPDLIMIGLEAEDKDEAFEEMVDRFCHARKIRDREEILEALWYRESKMSTGIRQGIAIPHARTKALDCVHGILGISKKGIDYSALDGEPVYILFMILIPLTESEEHQRLLKRLAELLDDHHFYTDLLAQNNPHNANEVIKKYEEINLASE